MEEGVMKLTQDDLALAVRLLTVQVGPSDEWWDRECRGLLERVTGHGFSSTCERCDGHQRIGTEQVCYRCDGVGYLTDDTENRRCEYCGETLPDLLEEEDGILVCGDEDCAIDHAKALQGIDADRWCAA